MAEESNQPQQPEKREEQGISSRSGTAPPIESRWKPGQSGNPNGRKTAGATLRELVNSYSNSNLSELELRKIARDKKLGWTNRAAAERVLRTLEAPDLSDFAGLLSGEYKLEDARAMGINTEAVRRFKQKTRKVAIGDGEVEEVIEREIELYDRAGTDFDRVCDRTEGTPKQTIDMKMEATHKAETHQTMGAILTDPAAYAAAVLIAEKAENAGPEHKPD